MMGRSLLRARLHRRARPIGPCPRCGRSIEGSEDWIDAERVVADHARICEVEQPLREAHRLRVLLRPAL